MPIYPNIYQTLLPGPIVELRGYLAACGLRGRLYAYLNYNGPTGTARDELAEGMLALALERGALTPGQTIVEAVSGPFATALTLAGLTAGHPVTLVMPEDAPAMRQESLLRLGAQIIHTPAQAGLAGARALGDSKSALYFLMISSVLNIGGDLFFVEVLGWGSEGCALSTVLSEALCCVLCVVYIQLKVPVLQLGRRWFVFDGSLLRSTVQYGWTSAMQQATVQLGKIAVQAIVNTLGINAMAAFTAASRVDDFTYMPQQNIAHAMTTLMAQNHGAGKKERVRQGFFCGLRIELIYGFCLMAVCLLFARPIISLFVDDPAVIDLGVKFLRCASLFYLMPGVTNGIQGGFRGLGDLKITLNSSMLNMGFRVAAAAVLVLVLKVDLQIMPVSYGIGWLSMLVYELPLLIRYMKEDKL